MVQFQLPYFKDLSPSWNSVSALGIRRFFPKGSLIIDLESTLGGVYFLQEGLVEVSLYTTRGPQKSLFYVGSGCIFGEVSCFVAGGSGENSVRARTDCTAYYFSREILEGPIAHQYPHLLLELIRGSTYKIRMYSVLLKDSLGSDNFIRVCKMLVYLVRFKGEPAAAETVREVLIQPDLTQTDIAHLLGIHRVTVTKAISRLKKMGIVGRFSKKALEILDYPALCQMIQAAEE